MTPTSFQLKLQLLRTLRQGNIEQVSSLLSEIVNQKPSNPALYDQFHQFVDRNR